ncbi:hypothetical protein D3C87_1434370 [compost metagenome]
MNTELDSELDRELSDALRINRDFTLQRSILVKYKEKGFSSESVYKLLGTMKIGVSEDIEDRILELMDITCGFCSPNMRVW